MPQPGGASAKDGLRYEYIWTVMCMARVIRVVSPQSEPIQSSERSHDHAAGNSRPEIPQAQRPVPEEVGTRSDARSHTRSNLDAEKMSTLKRADSNRGARLLMLIQSRDRLRVSGTLSPEVRSLIRQ